MVSAREDREHVVDRPERRVERHAVDEHGLVDCGRRPSLPTLADCAACADLVGAVVDANECVVAVRCRVVVPRPPGRRAPSPPTE